MRVLLFTLDFPPLGGGISRYNEGLARYWPAGELAVLAPDFPGSREIDAAFPCPVFRRRFFLQLPVRNPAREMPATLRAASEVFAAYRPDILFCGQPLTTALAAQLLSQRRPMVVFAHGEELRRHRDPGLRRTLLRRVLSRAARLVVVSEYGRNEAAWHGAEGDRVLKVTGILPEYFEPAPETLPEDMERLIGKRPLLLSVGRLENRKGHDLVVEALARLGTGDGAPVAMVVGEGECRDALLTRARELGVADRLLLPGRVSEVVLRGLYRRAALFVLAARTGDTGEEEGLGLAFIEAAAAGTPAIGTWVGGIPEAVLDGETGFLVRPGSSHELAAAVARLLTDRNELAAMGSRARERARLEYDWRVNAPRLREMVKGLVPS